MMQASGRSEAPLSGQVLRFGVVGVCATLAHAIVLRTGVEEAGLAPVAANAMAFLVAVSVTFFGQSAWVFRDLSFSADRIARFAATAVGGLIANAALMALVVDGLGLHYWVGFAVVIAVVPAMTFALSRFWVFRIGESRAAIPQDLVLPALVLTGLLLVVLLATPVFPFVDYYAHVGRYHALAELAGDPAPAIAESYASGWALLPNLGLDLIGTGLMLALDPLAVATLIVAVVVATLFTGTLYLSRVLHGRVPATCTLLASVLVFNHILVWGFVNFLFGLGLMAWALGFWIANDSRPARQLVLSVPIGLGLLMVHGVAFALWGLMLGMIELARLHQERRLFTAALPVRMGRLALLAVLPALLFLQMPTSDAQEGVTAAFGNLAGHAERGNLWPRLLDEAMQRLNSVLRVAESRWLAADYALNALMWAGLAAGVATGVLRLHPRLRGAVALALVLVAITPPNLFGVGYLDDRMPLLVLVLLAAGLELRAPAPARGRILAVLAGFAVLRAGLLAAGWAEDGRVYRDYLERTRALALEGPAAMVLAGEARERDTGATRCEPLLPLLLLEHDVPVTTFANPTQQPLRIAGPLADAIAARKEAGPEGAPGFRTIVVCGETRPAAPSPAMRKLAEGSGWAVFATAPPPSAGVPPAALP